MLIIIDTLRAGYFRPFCPAKKNKEHYTTYGGAKNNSINLAKFIEAPNKFATSIESDARPKNGETGKDGRPNQTFTDNEQEKLNTILKTKSRKCKWQAHHAFSGDQCLKGHDVEKFIIAGDKLKYDTGYSVNNPQNGVWLPSGFNMIKWPSDPAEKYKLSKSAMDEFQRQFHLGHHDITVDVDGLDPAVHEKYVNFVKRHLSNLHTILLTWLTGCPEEDKKEKKHLGNPMIHAALDHIVCLKRISFDGYGCCNIGNETRPMNEIDSEDFKRIILSEEINQERMTQIIKKTISDNKDLIWEDALKEYKLI